jgi:hypothetical protein
MSDPIRAAARAMSREAAKPAAVVPQEPVQVDATTDQELTALFLKFKADAVKLGAVGVMACAIMEKEPGKPESRYLAHNMHGPADVLHKAAVILVGTLSAHIQRNAGAQPAVMVPEAEARRMQAEKNGGGLILLPGAANGR